MKCARLASLAGVIGCMLLVLSLTSCSKKGDPLTPENDSTIKDLIIRNAQWNEDPDQPIQDNGNICGHVDNSVVVYSEYSHSGRQGFIFKGWDYFDPNVVWPFGMAIIAWAEKENQLE